MASMTAFHNQSERVRAQYENVALLSEALMQTQVILTCATFSRKWTMRSIPRSSYHPAVIHNKAASGEMQHRTPAMTWLTILRLLKLKCHRWNPRRVSIQKAESSHWCHYTRSCSCSTSWHYFENGHEKDPSNVAGRC